MARNIRLNLQNRMMRRNQGANRTQLSAIRFNYHSGVVPFAYRNTINGVTKIPTVDPLAVKRLPTPIAPEVAIRQSLFRVLTDVSSGRGRFGALLYASRRKITKQFHVNYHTLSTAAEMSAICHALEQIRTCQPANRVFLVDVPQLLLSL